MARAIAADWGLSQQLQALAAPAANARPSARRTFSDSRRASAVAPSAMHTKDAWWNSTCPRSGRNHRAEDESAAKATATNARTRSPSSS